MTDVSHDISGFLRLLHEDRPFEVRILKVGESGATYSGFFDNIAIATQEIENFDKKFKPKAIYCSMNECSLGTKERTKKDGTKYHVTLRVTNKLRKVRAGECLTNADMSRRRWLFVDVDPVRPTGINSSDEQMLASIDTARTIRDDLVASGWPEPIAGMSGNGAYLLWKTDLVYDESNRRLVSDCIYALLQKHSPNAQSDKAAIDLRIQEGTYDDEENAESLAMDIDRSIHNVARICKVLGTMSRKGTDSELRPQRLSWFIPHTDLKLVTLEQLDALASTVETKQSTRNRSSQEARPHVSSLSASSHELSEDDPIIQDAIAEQRAKLAQVPSRFASDRDAWMKIGMSLHFVHGSMLNDWIQFSQKSSKYVTGECENMWANFQRTGGITEGTINHYIPNEFAARKYICERMALMQDIDDANVQSMLFKDLEQFNRTVNVPLPDSQLLKVFTISHRKECLRRAVDGHSVGSGAIKEVVESLVNEPANPVAVENLPEDAVGTVKRNDSFIEKLEDKTVITDEDKKKVFEGNARVFKTLAAPALSLQQKQIIEKWKLYRYDEDPVVYQLIMPHAHTNDDVTLTLSSHDILSFQRVDVKSAEVGSLLPYQLAKHWRAAVNELFGKTIVMKADKDRDRRCLIAGAIVDLCLRSTTSIDRLNDDTGGTRSALYRGTSVFYQGTNSAVEAFWFNSMTIYNELDQLLPSLNLRHTDYRKAFAEFDIKTRENVPRGLVKLRTRMTKVDIDVFRVLCDYAGIEFSMMTHEARATSYRPSENQNAYSLSSSAPSVLDMTHSDDDAPF